MKYIIGTLLLASLLYCAADAAHATKISDFNSYEEFQQYTIDMNEHWRGQVNAERKSRQAKDADLQEQIDNLKVGTDTTIIQEAIDKEASTRIESDRKQQSQLDYHNEHIQNLYNELDKNYDEHSQLDKKIDKFNNQSLARDKKQNANIEMNRQSINSVKSTVSTFDKRIQSNTNSITRLDNRVTALDNKVNRLDDKLESGLATVTALTQLHPNPRFTGKTQIAIGTGMYQDNVAGAVGIFHYFNDRIMMNASASYGGNSSWAGGIGLSIGIGGN